MTFRLLEDETVPAGIRRIVTEQIDKAVHEIQDSELDRHETVHQVRKRCKKIRGVIRLVRPCFEDTYQRENAAFRDAARSLSNVRDAEAVVETYDALMAVFADQVDRHAFEPVREALVRRRRRVIEDQTDLDERLDRFVLAMIEARARVEDWPLDTEGFEAVGGLEKTYRRGRKAMAAAYADPGVERFHEWRKRAKYHRYHVRLLRDAWKPVMAKVRSEVKTLSDLLGDDHDLAVLRRTLLDDPGTFGEERTLQAVTGLIDRRRLELQLRARALGERVFAEKPGALGRRLGAYWGAWHIRTDERSATAAP